MGKFDETFGEPVYFSDGSYAINGLISKNEAIEAFAKYCGEDVDINLIRLDRVRFCFPPERMDIDPGVACWRTGASGKGSKPVWMYDIQLRDCDDELIS